MSTKTRTHRGPGRSDREGLSLLDLFDMFPTEAAAVEWFESIRWPNGVDACPRCGEIGNVAAVRSGKPMPWRCGSCRQYFSVRTGTVMESSRLPLRKWVVALYLCSTNLKGVSSMKLHRDLGVTQKTAWFMLGRIREAWADAADVILDGTVEVDETYVGGKEKNKHASKRLGADHWSGKAVVVGARSRDRRVTATVIDDTTAPTLQGFVHDHMRGGSTLYTDGAEGYKGVGKGHDLDRDIVRHSVGEYVRGEVHTNGMESFWSMLKRGYYGTYHKMSFKHLGRYVAEFAARHNVRDFDTLDQMAALAEAMEGKRLMYRDLTAGEQVYGPPPGTFSRYA